MKKTYSIGLDYGTESVRALLVDGQTGEEVAVSVERYAHGVMSPQQNYALQHPQDYLDAGKKVLKEVAGKVSSEQIIGLGVDFTACTMLPVDRHGTPLCFLPSFQENPHALAKLWKHHGAQAEAEAINLLAKKRHEKFLAYYGGTISCEWMLPKVFETLNKAPEVFYSTCYFMDAGDWVVGQMIGGPVTQWKRSATFAGYKGLWNKEYGYPSETFLKELHPSLEKVSQKWIGQIAAPGTLAGMLNEQWAKDTGLATTTAISVATIDAHSGVPGMGVYQDGTACLIMGTSTCHMFLSGELRLFSGMAGAVADGIIPGLIGYESGQAAVGDLFAWYTQKCSPLTLEEVAKKAYALQPGSSGLVALDWMNGNRSVLMNNDLSGVLLGLTLETRPEDIYRALVEATAFGTKKIIQTYQAQGIPVRKIAVCGGLTAIPEMMQIYSDILECEVEVAHSSQAVALGAAIFGALAAGQEKGGYGHIEEAVLAMTQKSSTIYRPQSEHFSVYRQLYQTYQAVHRFFGEENPQLMRNLRQLKKIKGESHA